MRANLILSLCGLTLLAGGFQNIHAAPPPNAKLQAKAAAATPAPCDDSTRPLKGGHHFYCVEPQFIAPESYCLRQSGSRPVHVRQWITPDAVITSGVGGHATFDKVCANPASSPCKKKFTAIIPGNHLTVVNGPGATLKMTIESRPAVSLTIDPSKFFAKGSDAEWEYYLLLADDDLGQTIRKNVSRIERYLVVEAFDVNDTSADCAAEKPSANNFHPWLGDPMQCTIPTCPSENGTGGGGHDYP